MMRNSHFRNDCFAFIIIIRHVTVEKEKKQTILTDYLSIICLCYIFVQKKDMENEIKYQFLFYDFIYDGIRHRAKIKLEEDNHCVRMLYDEHNLEVTEPDYWSFVDEECPANNTDKYNFYKQ